MSRVTDVRIRLDRHAQPSGVLLHLQCAGAQTPDDLRRVVVHQRPDVQSFLERAVDRFWRDDFLKASKVLTSGVEHDGVATETAAVDRVHAALDEGTAFDGIH